MAVVKVAVAGTLHDTDSQGDARKLSSQRSPIVLKSYLVSRIAIYNQVSWRSAFVFAHIALAVSVMKCAGRRQRIAGCYTLHQKIGVSAIVKHYLVFSGRRRLRPLLPVAATRHQVTG